MTQKEKSNGKGQENGKSTSNNVKKDEKQPEIKESAFPDDPRLEEKTLFRVDEVARYFDVSERTVRIWIEHGHLKNEKIVGSIRVTRDSILRCRFR